MLVFVYDIIYCCIKKAYFEWVIANLSSCIDPANGSHLTLVYVVDNSFTTIYLLRHTLCRVCAGVYFRLARDFCITYGNYACFFKHLTVA